METPLSSRRITRSQAKALASENTIPVLSRGENDESMKFGSKSRQKTNGGKHQEREKNPLIDITNGSPIVGLAMGSLKTPSSMCSKKRTMISNSQSKQATTPGSGESILRGQVKTLLQKVEEEGVISKISFENNNNPLMYKRFLNSPIAVLAPTPANTPQVYDFSTSNNGCGSFVVSPVAENFSFAQMLNEIMIEPKQEDKNETDENIVITRSLFMDFSEKFEGSDSPVQGSDASGWSIQVNPSTSEEFKDEEEEYDDDYEDGDDVVVDELCEAISKINVNNDSINFTGKHIRFVYNSDGELEEEIESSKIEESGILCLKGLPTPKGKHLRFQEENESEEEEIEDKSV